MADGSRHELAFSPETSWGTTDASPVFQKIRNSSVNLVSNKDELLSEEIRSDRQRFDMRQGAYKVTGDVGVELSYGTFDLWLQALTGGTWTDNVLKAGTTRRSFTMERKFNDVTDYPWYRFVGCEVDKLSLSVANNAIVKGTFGFLGKGGVPADTIVAGATYTDPTTTTVFDAFTGTINEGGSSIAVVTEMSIEIANGLTPRHVIGSKYTLRPSIGYFDVNGTATLWFENNTQLLKFINETESSLDFTLTDLAGNSLKIEIPRLKYSGAAVDVSGIGPIKKVLPFRALLDTVTTDSNIVFTRTPV